MVFDPYLNLDAPPAPATPAPATPATATPGAPASGSTDDIPTVTVHGSTPHTAPLQATPQPTPGVGTGAPTGPAPAGTPAPQPAVVFDPYLNLKPDEPAAPLAIPPEVAGQEIRNQPWYQAINDYVTGATGAVSHGATFGLDEIVAPLMPAIVESLRTGKPFTESYDNEVAKMRQPRANFEDQNPIAGNALEMGGGLATGKVFNPLFAPARVGPVSAAQKVVDFGRNVVAGAGVGGATSFTSTPGDLQDRVDAAKQGALAGGTLSVVAPTVIKTGASTVRAFRPSAQVPNIVGRTVQEDVGGVPGVQPAPLPNVGLNLPQSTGSPAAARTLDTLNSIDTSAAQQQRSKQNQEMLDALSGRVQGEPAIHTETGKVPERTAATGSTKATKALQDAAKIIDTEEKRRWNTPALAERPISTYSTKDTVNKAISDMRREDPGLGLALDGSPEVQRVLRGLRLMPPKTTANEINTTSSKFRAIARSSKYDNDVRHVATRLANATQDGIWQAPEIAGLAPMSQSELDLMNKPAAPRPPSAAPAASKVVGGEPARPVDAVTSIIDKGGLKDPQSELAGRDPDKKRHRFQGQFLGKVVNKDTGMTPDEARNFLRDNGYLTTEEAKDEGIAAKLVEEHLAGNPRYRASDAAEAEYWRQQDEGSAEDAYRVANARAEVQHVADQNGIRLTPDVLDHAAQLRLDDPQMHPEEALINATTASHEQIATWNAQRNAFGPAGMPPGTMAYQLPDMEQLRNGVKADPEIRNDLERARAFTKREAETLGHASFDNILKRNSRGNETVTPGTALSKFFDFDNGVERPGDIRRVSQFLDDIKSEWQKLKIYDQKGLYNPDTIAPVRQELEDGARNYIMGKMLDAISSGERDMTGNRMLQYRQAMNWLDTNRDMLERSGLFSGDQMDLLDRFRATAELLQRDKEMARTAGSPTFTRAMDVNRFVDLFTGPLVGRAMGMTAGAVMGNFMTRWLGEAAIGAMIGAEMGGAKGGNALMQAIYNVPRQKLLEAYGEAYRNPQIAHDLAQKAGTAGTTRPSAATLNWIRGLVASSTGSTAGRYAPVEHPALAQ